MVEVGEEWKESKNGDDDPGDGGGGAGGGYGVQVFFRIAANGMR